jgi:hypothetical protein
MDFVVRCVDFVLLGVFLFSFLLCLYSQTCIKRSPLGHGKRGLIRQVTS